MNNEQYIRKRFCKPHHFLSSDQEDVMKGLQEVFANYHPRDFVEELRKWQTLAMTNEQSVYENADAREDLLDFTATLMKLSEALWIVCDARCRIAKIETPWRANDVQLQVLNEKERDRPYKVIRHCCSTFTRQYAQTELLDLLDAVITYEGDRQVHKGSLILMYLHLEYLVKAAYAIHNGEVKL